MHFNKSLNPDNEVGGEIDLKFALNYADRYNAGIDGYGYSFGRIATTKRVIQILFESGIKQVLFGVGPGSTIPSFLDSKKERKLFDKRYDEFMIQYGFTTINRIALEYGVAGVSVYLFLIYLMTKKMYSLQQN